MLSSDVCTTPASKYPETEDYAPLCSAAHDVQKNGRIEAPRECEKLSVVIGHGDV